MAPLTINDNTIDPDSVEAGYFKPDASDTNFILLSTRHYLEPSEYRELRARSVLVQSLVTVNDGLPTYLCKYEPSDLAILEALPFVQSALVYHQDFVLDPELKVEDLTQPGHDVSTKDSGPSEDKPLCRVEITLHANTSRNGDDLFDEIQRMMPQDSGLEKINSTSGTLQAWVPIRILSSIASIDHVRTVHPTPDVKPYSTCAREIINSPHVNHWFPLNQIVNGANQGAGQIVAVCDGGLDRATWNNGTTDGIHPGFMTTTPANAIVSRIANTDVEYTIRGKPGKYKLDDADGHGTHVAGIVMGAFQDQTMGLPLKSRVTIGIAPAAKVFVQKYEIEGAERPFEELFDEALAANAQIRIHNYSWGPRVDVWVRTYARGGNEIDKLLNTNGPPPSRPILMVLAAGNDGGSLVQWPSSSSEKRLDRQIGGSASAKNGLVVGNSWSKRLMQDTKIVARPYSDTACVEVVGPGGGLESDFCIASGSSKGPTPDGFLKPDVVAPGVGILSTFSRTWRAWWAKPGAGKPNYNPHEALTYLSGTSMAAPVVSGLAACLREAGLIRATAPVDLRAETMKAIIVNAAVSCQGGSFWYRDDTKQWARGILGPPPDCIQGHGRADWSRSLRHVNEMGVPKPLVPLIPPLPLAPPVLQPLIYSPTGFFESPNGITHGQVRSIEFVPNAQTTKLCVTLVYHDKEGTALQHKLQLRVSILLYNYVTQAETQQINKDATDNDINRYPGLSNYLSVAGEKITQGNVQKVTWNNLIIPNAQLGQVCLVRITVNCVVVTFDPSVNYSLAWIWD